MPTVMITGAGTDFRVGTPATAGSREGTLAMQSAPQRPLEPIAMVARTIRGCRIVARTFDADPRGLCKLCPICIAAPVQDGRHQCITESPATPLYAG